MDVAVYTVEPVDRTIWKFAASDSGCPVPGFWPDAMMLVPTAKVFDGRYTVIPELAEELKKPGPSRYAPEPQSGVTSSFLRSYPLGPLALSYPIKVAPSFV